MNNKKLQIKFEYLNLIDKNLKKKILQFSENRLYITEEKLKTHFSENEVLELLKEGILKDTFLE